MSMNSSTAIDLVLGALGFAIIGGCGLYMFSPDLTNIFSPDAGNPKPRAVRVIGELGPIAIGTLFFVLLIGGLSALNGVLSDLYAAAIFWFLAIGLPGSYLVARLL